MIERLTNEFEILNIAVYPKWRGLGLATALLTQVLREAIKKGIKKCFLEVRRSNLPALHLYNRAGFLQVGLRRHYYPTGEDALVMVYHPQKSCLGVRGDVSASSDWREAFFAGELFCVWGLCNNKKCGWVSCCYPIDKRGALPGRSYEFHYCCQLENE